LAGRYAHRLDRRIRKAVRATLVASPVNFSIRSMVSIYSTFVNDNIFRAE
jgi:hypothetical protein